MVHHGLPAVKRPRFLPMVAFVATLVACDEGVAPPRPDTLELSLGVTQMVVGETLTVTAIYRDDRGTPVEGDEITWSSSRTDVAQVDPDGVVNAVGPGETVLSAAGGGFSATTLITVFDAPALMLERQGVAFETMVGGADPDPVSVVVSNASGGSLAGLSSSVTFLSGESQTWLEADLDSEQLPAALSVRPTVSGLQPGRYTAVVSVFSNDASNGPQLLAVSLVVDELPELALSPSEVEAEGDAGGSGPQGEWIMVTNEGGGSVGALELSIDYGGGAEGWLDADLDSNGIPTAVLLNFDTSGLSAGAHAATIWVSDASGQADPVSCSVTLTLEGGQPVMTLSRTQVSFGAAQGGADPPPQTVDVGNDGEGQLSGLGASVTYHAGQPGGWLTATLDAAQAPSTMTLAAAAGTLPDGVYSAEVSITSDDPDQTSEVDVVFTVGNPGNPGTMESDPDTVDLEVELGDTVVVSGSTEITATGDFELTGLQASIQYGSGSGAGWLSASLSDDATPATLILSANPGGLSVGLHTATVTVTSALGQSRDVVVLLDVGAPITISVDPEVVTLQAQLPGVDPPPASAVVSAAGGAVSDLSISVEYQGAAGGWLTASLSSSTSPTVLNLAGSVSGQASGNHTAIVRVHSQTASNGPVEVVVVLAIP